MGEQTDLPTVPSEQILPDTNSQINCCACGMPLSKRNVSGAVLLGKVVQWRFPLWGFNGIMESWDRAIAMICKECKDTGKPVKYAIEIDRSSQKVFYHELEKLVDATNIGQEERLVALGPNYGPVAE